MRTILCALSLLWLLTGCVSEEQNTSSTCPTTAPEPGSACSGALGCDFGEECCLGQCFPSLSCNCRGGTWQCVSTDACLLNPDVVEDTTEDSTEDTSGGDTVESDTSTGDTSTADTTEADTSTADTTATDTTDPDAGANCPTSEPIGEACEDEGLECAFGEECCGGQCYPSLRCTCSSGSWACLNTDACFGFQGPGEGECRGAEDCDNLEFCQAPDEQNCGVCQDLPTCTDDAGCGEGQVCSSTREPSCLCNPGGSFCVAACTSDDDCGDDGLTCVDGHCEAISCSTDEDCPTLYRCAEGVCLQRTCKSDSECPRSSPCVEGRCFDSYGSCSLPVP